MNIEYRIAELERRLEILLRPGVVSEADYRKARGKVKSGEMETGWIPWLTNRAAGDIDWWAPEVGEQVLVLSPGGDPAQAIMLPALYQQAYPAPSADENVRRVEFADGTTVEYDREAHLLNVICVGSIEVHAAEEGSVRVDGDVMVNVDGNLLANVGGNLTANVGGNLTAETDGDAAITVGGRMDIEAAAVKFAVDGRFEVQASNITIGNTVKDGNGIDSSLHTHAGVQSGSSTTGPAQ
jgi:phage baseplate assembly protein V